MSLYFLLATLNTDGQQMVHANPNMVVDATRSVSIPGAEILGRYAVLGHYDFIMMIEADNHEAVARLSLEVGVKTGMHIETLPAIAMGFLTEPGTRDDIERPTSVQRTPDDP